MNQQPDKLFRDKLQGYQPAVPADAWRKVSGNLGQKSDRMIWLKVAAGLLLLAVAGIFLYPVKNSETPAFVSGKALPDKKQELSAEEKVVAGQTRPAEKDEVPANPSPAVKHKTPQAEERKNAGKSPVTETLPPETTERPLAEDREIQEEKDPVAANEPLPVDQMHENKNVTIVFIAAEVNEKYLNKKNAGAEATSEEKETSTWRKLLDKAYDLKHNQDPMGNLRQKKNEILALNFKNEKQRHENH